MTTKQRRDFYGEITERVLEALDQGIVPWRRPWATTYPTNLISKKPYRGINTLLLGMSTHQSPYWLTFKQAKSLGGSVRKGEKGTGIVFWKFIDRKEENEAGEVEERKVPIMRFYTVFNVDQCDLPDGIVPANEDGPLNDGEPIAEAHRVATAYIDREGIGFDFGECAYYKPLDDMVVVPPIDRFTNKPEYYSTLFHELSHSTGHTSRLGRTALLKPTFFGSHEYSKEELVAEMGAAFCCAVAGIDSEEAFTNSVSYINGWKNKIANDKKLVIHAAQQAQKAADLIIGTEV